MCLRAVIALFFIFGTAAQAKIIGKDNRVAVTKHSKETWGVGVLYAEFPGMKFYKCSGTLISHNKVLTAAHCVYQKELGGYPKRLSFIPGTLKTDNQDDDRYIATKAWINKSFLRFKEGPRGKRPSPSNDIAVIHLQSKQGMAPGEKYGYKGYISSANQQGIGSNLSYPNQGLDMHTLKAHYGCFYEVKWSSDQFFSSDCDTFNGSSGSALLNDKKQIIGVLSAGAEHENYFTKITEEVMHQIDGIARGEEQQPLFAARTFDATNYFAVHLKNKCSRSVYIAYSYKGLDLQWHTEGFTVLKPGQVIHNAFLTQNTVIGFYAQTYNGDLKWSGEDYRLKVQGKHFDFYRKDLPQDFTDRTFSWSCD